MPILTIKKSCALICIDRKGFILIFCHAKKKSWLVNLIKMTIVCIFMVDYFYFTIIIGDKTKQFNNCQQLLSNKIFPKGRGHDK